MNAVDYLINFYSCKTYEKLVNIIFPVDQIYPPYNPLEELFCLTVQVNSLNVVFGHIIESSKDYLIAECFPLNRNGEINWETPIFVALENLIVCPCNFVSNVKNPLWSH